MIVQKKCTLCNEPSFVEVDDAAWAEYERGLREGLSAMTHGAQVLFPGLSPGDREVLISGTHSECWDRAFSHMEEE